MLASTIQFTTNPPTPTPTTHKKGKQKSRPGNQGALPQNPDSMPPPHAHKHAQRHPPTPPPTQTQEAEARGCVFYTKNDKPATPHKHVQDNQHAFREQQPPTGPDPFSGPDKTNSQKATPTQTYP